MVEIAFVTPLRPGGARIALLDAIRDELHELGVRSRYSPGLVPAARAGLVYAVFAGGTEAAPDGSAADAWGSVAVPPHSLSRRTIALCLRDATPLAVAGPPLGAVFDVSPAGVEAWRERGVAADHFRLGHTVAWASPTLEDPRDVDVVVGGAASERRSRLIASYGGMLARARCVIALDGREPPLELLRRAKVLLDVHVAEPWRFDHLRATRAILSGAVVVTEHAPGMGPLVPGEHLLSGRAETLGHLVQELLETDRTRVELRRAAFGALSGEPLRAAVERLAAAAEELDAREPVPRRAAWRAPEPPAPPPPVLAPDSEVSGLRRAVKQLRLDGIDARRRMERMERIATSGSTAAVEVLARTPAHAGARPRVSVLVTLYDYEQHIEAALESVALSTLREVEVVVVDDASGDRSAQRAREWMERRPHVPALLLGHRWNRGLPHARNTALDFARAELCFVLDADNELYPQGLARLVGALDADPGADFAYGLIECFGPDRAAGLLSVGEWDPDRLRVDNYIDAMALVRTAALRPEGFATDPRLHGLEDYELWCRMAERGRRGVAVPELVARYRVSDHAMLRATTGLSRSVAMSVLIERHPRLMAGVLPPP